MTDQSAVSERIAKLKAAKKLAEPEVTEEYADLIPDIEPREKTAEGEELDQFIARINIADAYKRWINKSQFRVGNRSEGIKVSCPNPDHPDRDPSAWLNTEKNLWFCGGCDEGGDVYDLAAWHFGYPRPGYKSGEHFHKLREDMAKDYGYRFFQPPGVKKPILVAPEPEPEAGTEDGADENNSASESSTEQHLAEVVNLFDAEDILFPTLEWQGIVPEDTFLYEYMKATIIDDVPEEYHFWNGLVGLGLIVGRDVKLFDHIPVLGNMFVCLLGHTGDGKSRSYAHLASLLNMAMPFNWTDDEPKGVRFVKTPASAESLIHQFSKPVMDPINPKQIAFYAPIKGLIEFNELSQLTSRSSRAGNAIKPTLMEFYDGSDYIATSSMTTGTKMARDAFGSAFTTAQPRALRELLRQQDADSGFLNRWFFASGKPKQRIAIGGIQVDMKPVVPYVDAIKGWAGFGKQIEWAPDGAARYTEFFHEVLRPTQLRDESGLLTRLDLLTKKLILLFCVNEHQNTVTSDIVSRVIKMFPYLLSAYGIPATQIGGSLVSEVQEHLLQAIEKHSKNGGKGASLRELTRSIARKKYPADLVVKVLKSLVELDIVQLDDKHKGPGRPTVRYKYVG